MKLVNTWRVLKDSPNGVETVMHYNMESEARRECDALNARGANGYNSYRVAYADELCCHEGVPCRFCGAL